MRRTLNLLNAQTYADFEVIVVDDGSTDTTPRLLQEFAGKVTFPLKTLSQTNSGQGVARNQGIEQAEGEILLFLGDDMLPANNLLEKHAEFHDIHTADSFACLGLVEWSREIKVTRFMRWLTRSGVQFKFDDLQKNSQTDFWRFYTANISLKRKLLGDERFNTDFKGWGFEDAELGLRLEKKGMRLLYNPDAVVQHFHKISDESLAERQRQAGKNAVQFQKLHPDVQVLPTGWKLITQRMIATLLPFTWYGKAKEAFLGGINEARNK